jgi:hypothetical protein
MATTTNIDGGELRALGQVRSGAPAFTPRLASGLVQQSDSIANRWAPESSAATAQAPALRALTFVDRLLAPHRPFIEGTSGRAPFTTTSPSADSVAGQAGASWWMFPVPWYADNMAAAAQQATRARPVVASSGGAPQTDVVPAQRPTWLQAAVADANAALGIVPPPVVSASVAQRAPSMEMLTTLPSDVRPAVSAERARAAPSVATATPTAPLAPTPAAVTPTPGLPAAVAPDVTTVAASPVAQSAPEGMPVAPGVEAVSVAAAQTAAVPTAATPPDALPTTAAPTAATPATASPTGALPTTAAPTVSVARPAGVPASMVAPAAQLPSPHLATLRAWSPLVTAPAAHAAAQVLEHRAAQTTATTPARAALAADTSWASSFVVPESPAVAPRGGARPATPVASTPAAPAQPVVSPVATAPAGTSPAVTSPSVTSPAVTSSSVTSSAVTSPAEPVVTSAPAAGPRVWMPAGLEGLFAGVGAASLVSQAQEMVASTSAAAPPRRADVPTPLAHVAWADAWLARVAGREDVVSSAREAGAVPSLPMTLPLAASPDLAVRSPAALGRAPRTATALTETIARGAEPRPLPLAATSTAPVYVTPEAGPRPAQNIPFAPPVATVNVPAPRAELPRVVAPVTETTRPAAASADGTAAPTSTAPAAAPGAPAIEPLLMQLAAPGLGLGAGLAASPVATALGEAGIAATSAPLASAVERARAPMAHVAWTDAWLKRFTGGAADRMPVIAPETGRPAIDVTRPGLPAAATGTTTFRNVEAPAQPVVTPEILSPASRAATPLRPAAAAPSAAAAAPQAPVATAPLGTVPERTTALPTVTAPSAAPDARSAPSLGFAPSLFASPSAPALGDLLGLPPALMQRLSAQVHAHADGPVTTVPGAGVAPSAARAPSMASLALPIPSASPATAATAATPVSSARPVLGRTAPTSPDVVDVGQPAMGFRPGAVGMQMESYAIEEKLRVSGLSNEYVSPELYAAAQVYGFGATDAARAGQLAELGRPLLTALAATTALPAAGRAQAAAPGATPIVPGAAPAPESRPLGALAASATPGESPLARLAPSIQMIAGLPEPTPRGAFLYSQPAMARLRQMPGVPGAEADVGQHAATPHQLAAIDVLAAAAVAGDESVGSSMSSSALESARESLGDDFVYAGSWTWQQPVLEDGGDFASAPVVRAARALARMASRNLPIVEPSAPAPASTIASYVSSSQSPASRAPSTSTMVQSGRAATPSSGASTTSSSSPGVAGLAAGAGDFQVPDWFEAAARKLLQEKGSDDSFGIPELTLIQAASASPMRIAAAEARDSAPTAAAGGGGGGGGSSDQKKSEDVEELALEVYKEFCRLVEANRERNGGE